MSVTRPKLVVSQRVEKNTAFWARRLVTDAWAKVPLSAGLLYVAGDGQADDLLNALSGAIQDALEVSTTWEVDHTTGIVSVVRDDVGLIQIAERDPTGSDDDHADGVFVGVDRSNLRFDDTLSPSLSVPGFTFFSGISTDALRCHQGGLYPSRASITDLPVKPNRNISQTRPTALTPQTLKYHELDEHDLTIATKNALPWASFYNEFDMITDFMANASTGRPLRHHRKREVLVPESKAEPFGYRTWVLARSSMEWRPKPAHRNFYKAFNKDLRLIAAQT